MTFIQPSGHSHSFDTGIARQCGLEAATVYNHLIYWLKHNKIEGINWREGRTWTYNSAEKMSQYMSYLSAHQIRRALDKLVVSGLLLKGNFNQNKFDRTAWYALASEDALSDLANLRNASDEEKKPISQICQMDNANLPNDQYTNINQVERPEREGAIAPARAQISSSFPASKEKKISKRKDSPAEKIAFGEHGYVLMSQAQYDKAVADCGQPTVDRNITALDEWIGRGKAKGERDHYLTLLAFIRREKENPKVTTGHENVKQIARKRQADSWIEKNGDPDQSGNTYYF